MQCPASISAVARFYFKLWYSFIKGMDKTCENARFSDQQLKQSLTALTFCKRREGWRFRVNRKVNMKALVWLGIMVLT